MTDIETVLTQRLRRRAGRAEVRFTLDDVTCASPTLLTAGTRPPRRWYVPAAAAAATAAVVAVAVVAWPDESTRVQVGPAEPSRPVVVTGEGTMRLSPGSGVLDVEGVGRIEVGPPPDHLVGELAWLASSSCVATPTALGCAHENDGRSFAEGSSDGFSVMTSRDGGDGPFVFVESAGASAAIVSGLSPAATLVVADLGAGPVRQVPALGTAAFPLEPFTTEIVIRALDADGIEVWADVLELPHPPGGEPQRS